MVWQHMHDQPGNVIGHADLEDRDDGLYAYCFSNKSQAGSTTKELVHNGDVNSLSVYANGLKQVGADVIHGVVRELSVVLSGANPEALIDNLYLSHSDEIDETEAMMYFNDAISTGEEVAQEEEVKHAATDSPQTLEDIINSMSEVQRNAMYAIIAHVAGDSSMAQSDNTGGAEMKYNAFEGSATATAEPTLSHDQVSAIFKDAEKTGSLKEAFLAHADTYGINDIDLLFPDAKMVTATPDWIKRDTEWVAGVLAGTRHTPFSRIKSMTADITADEARAKGYIKGNLKKEEVFGLLKRETTPTTIYKKQKLDRDDIIDVTTLNVVSWMKAEMRLMLNEEIARAILIGDGREVDNPDKINENNIRPIYKDADLYSIKVAPIAAGANPDEVVDAVLRAFKLYKGSGNPVMFTTNDVIIDLLLAKDSIGRRLYETEASVARALNVSRIVPVEVMEGISRVVGANTLNLMAIIVNLNDYVVGADAGGAISMFDDFDIDYNQYKYLIETRISGALIKPYSALIIEQIASTTP
jgi:hypothetical protein